MFEIRILNDERGANGERLGVISAGDLTERFTCTPANGTVAQLAARWLAALQSLLAGADSVALVHDPRFAWIVYREPEGCFIQQLMSLDGDFETIPPRETVTEDGERISEWAVSLSEIQRFVETQPGHRTRLISRADA